MLPRRDFGQEMYGKLPTQYANPDGGSDAIALELTDDPIHRQRISNSFRNGLTNGTSVAGRPKERTEIVNVQLGELDPFWQCDLTEEDKCCKM